MKKMTKLFSIVMALVLMLSVAVLPATAADPSAANVSFDLELVPVIGETDSNGLKSEENGIYKLIVYLTSDKRLCGATVDIVFDETKFAPLDECNDYTYTTDLEYNLPLFHRLGQMLDDNSYDSNGNVGGRAKYYGPNHAKSAQYNFKFTQTKTNALLWNYRPCENALELGECTREPMAEIYFKLLDGQQAEGAVFGFGTGVGTSAKGVSYDGTPTAGKFYVLANVDATNIMPISLIGTPDYTYTGSVAAGPALAHAKRQVKMSVANGAVVSGTEQMRVISTISAADWEAYFANTTNADATTNKITEVGIVAHKGADFDVEAAKAAAMNGSTADYTVKGTNYISTQGGVYSFAARIEYQSDVFDTSYIAYVKYLDAEGNEAFAFYDASYELAFKTNYTDITNKYLANHA